MSSKQLHPVSRPLQVAVAVALAFSYPAHALAADAVLPRIDVVGNDGQAVKKPGEQACIQSTSAS